MQCHRHQEGEEISFVNELQSTAATLYVFYSSPSTCLMHHPGTTGQWLLSAPPYRRGNWGSEFVQSHAAGNGATEIGSKCSCTYKSISFLPVFPEAGHTCLCHTKSSIGLFSIWKLNVGIPGKPLWLPWGQTAQFHLRSGGFPKSTPTLFLLELSLPASLYPPQFFGISFPLVIRAVWGALCPAKGLSGSQG